MYDMVGVGVGGGCFKCSSSHLAMTVFYLHADLFTKTFSVLKRAMR